MILKRLVFTVVTVAFTVTNAFAQDNMTLSNMLDKWLVSMGGSVNRVFEGRGEILLDNATVYKGMQFNIVREGEELKHPVTKAVLGKKLSNIGIATVDEVDNNTVKIKANSSLRKGDIASVKQPFMIKAELDELNGSQQAYIKNIVFNDNKFVEDDNSSYILKCAGTNNIECDFMFDNNTILTAEIASVDDITVNINKSDANDISSAYQNFNNEIVSVAIGNPFDNSDDVYIATATLTDVSIYKYDFDTKQLSITQRIENEFDAIVNVELFDANNNGIDELFISNIDDNKAHSYIYEYAKDAFAIVVEEDERMYRTYYANNKKHLVSQGYSDGAFAGYVNSVGFSDGKYTYSTIENALNIRLYGFGVYDIDNDGKNEVLGFNSSGIFNVISSDSKRSLYEDTYFGDTSHKILHSAETQISTQQLADGGEVPIYETRVRALSVYQRIIELGDARFLFANNIPVKRQAFGIDEYSSSNVALYMFYDNKVNEIAGSKVGLPTAIYEADINNVGGKRVLVVLSSGMQGKKGMGEVESIIIIAEI